MILFLPEITILLTGLVVLIYDLIVIQKENSKVTLCLSLSGIFLASLFLFQIEPGETLGGRFVLQGVDFWFKFIFLLASFFVLVFTFETFKDQSQKKIIYPAEFQTVLLFSLAGMMFLISSRDLVSLYVSLELATIPLFLLSAWSKDLRSGEGALKYLITGATASAILLYGFSLIYGLTGEMSFMLIAPKLASSWGLWLALGLVFVGIGFKLTLFPFHMWAPDAYEGAPTPVTAFLSVASKAAGLGLLFQLFFRVFTLQMSSMNLIFVVLAAATMTFGNVVAIRQTQIKRFMAFSAISQAGYLIMGFLDPSHEGVTSIIFYMLVYALTNLAAFAVIIHHVHQQGDESIEGLRGLSQSHPVLALSFMIALFGLAGIPPLSGFVGKFFLFSAAAKTGHYGLVLLAALNSTVSLYYYLRLVRQMYMEPVSPHSKEMKSSVLFHFGLAVTLIGSVVCGLIPSLYEHIDTNSIQLFSTLQKIGMNLWQ